MNHDPNALHGLEIALGIVVAYLFPAILAKARKHRQTLAIFLTNLLLGWTVLGWIAASIWACTAPRAEKVVVVQRDDGTFEQTQ